MTLREAIQALREYALTPQTGPDAHGTERSEQVERALDLLCVGADPDDPAIQAAVDEINIARGVGSHPHSAGYVKLENYGVNHMSGRGRRGAAYLREHIHRLVRGEAEPQTVKAVPEKVRMSLEHRDEPRTLG